MVLFNSVSTKTVVAHGRQESIALSQMHTNNTAMALPSVPTVAKNLWPLTSAKSAGGKPPRLQEKTQSHRRACPVFTGKYTYSFHRQPKKILPSCFQQLQN
jgi:hypothetical protein